MVRKKQQAQDRTWTDDPTVAGVSDCETDVLNEDLMYLKEHTDALETSIVPLQEHLTNTNNPHYVTKGQVGLGNVDNTSDLDKPVSAATEEAIRNMLSSLDAQPYNELRIYAKGDWVTATIEGEKNIFQSIQDDNTGHPLTDTAWWEKKEFSGGGSGAVIGDIGIALYIDETEGLRRRLTGGLLIISDNTQGFLNYLLKIDEEAPSLFTNETNWQAVNTQYGECPMFVIDQTAGTIRLPNIVNPIRNLKNLSDLGTIAEAMIPNIKGRTVVDASSNMGGSTTIIPDGVFSRDVNPTIAKIDGGNNNTLQVYSGYMNASRASSVYKDEATTVQQQGAHFPYFIQIASGAQTEVITNTIETLTPYYFGQSEYSEVDPQNDCLLVSLGQENEKAIYPDYYAWILKNVNNGAKNFKGQVGYGYSDTGAVNWFWISTNTPKIGMVVYGYEARMPCGVISELATDGFVFTDTFANKLYTVTRNISKDTYGTDWFNDYDWQIDTEKEVFILPLLNGSEDLLSKKADNLTLGASGSSYRAPANGWYYIQFPAENDKYIDIYNRTISSGIISSSASSNTAIRAMAQVNRGNEVGIRYSATGTVSGFKFIYAKGNGNLYFYVGDKAQNKGLINEGRVLEALAKKVSVPEVKKIAMEAFIPDYNAGVSKSNKTTYTAEVDGMIYTFKSSYGSNIPSPTLVIDGHSFKTAGATGSGAFVIDGCATFFINKGSTYSATNQDTITFYPLKGALNSD